MHVDSTHSNPLVPIAPTTWVLLRGLSREQRHWHDTPAWLAERLDANVITVDLPGFGTERDRTSPSSVSAITDDLRERVDISEPIGLIGMSLGGMVVLDWASRFPDDIARAITVNTSSGASPAWRRFRPGGLRTIMARPFETRVRERASIRVTSNRPLHEVNNVLDLHTQWANESPPTSASLAAQMRAASTFQLPASVDVPLLVLASGGDRLVDWRCSAVVADRLGAPLYLHPDGGHDLTLDASPWVVNQIATWNSLVQ